MLISAYFQAVNCRCDDRRTKTHVGRRLLCCNEESIKVLHLHSGVGGGVGSGGAIQDVLQLVSCSSWRVRKQGVAITPEVMLDENP